MHGILLYVFVVIFLYIHNYSSPVNHLRKRGTVCYTTIPFRVINQPLSNKKKHNNNFTEYPTITTSPSKRVYNPNRNVNQLLLLYPNYTIRDNYTYKQPYVILRNSLFYRIVFSLSKKKSFPKPRKHVLKSGIVFYVYGANRCQTQKDYIRQVLINTRYIKELDNSINLALMTNCDLPIEIAQFLDVIGPIHNNDVMNIKEKQWRTRMLYNAYLPFKYSFIVDSHVFPCDVNAPKDILREFEQSQIDISFSNRKNIKNAVMGAAVLSQLSTGSFEFWKQVYLLMEQKNFLDDQYPMSIIVRSRWSKSYKYKYLSNNWCFASHGINEKGEFIGSSNCYRSSIILTGPVRFIHGHIFQCQLMNKNPNTPRCYFQSGTCNTTGKGFHAIYSRKELMKTVYPYRIPELSWEINSKKNKSSLFW